MQVPEIPVFSGILFDQQIKRVPVPQLEPDVANIFVP